MVAQSKNMKTKKRKLDKPSKKEFFILRETKKGPAMAWGAVDTNQVLDTWMDEIELLEDEGKLISELAKEGIEYEPTENQ